MPRILVIVLSILSLIAPAAAQEDDKDASQKEQFAGCVALYWQSTKTEFDAAQKETLSDCIMKFPKELLEKGGYLAIIPKDDRLMDGMTIRDMLKLDPWVWG